MKAQAVVIDRAPEDGQILVRDDDGREHWLRESPWVEIGTTGQIIDGKFAPKKELFGHTKRSTIAERLLLAN